MGGTHRGEKRSVPCQLELISRAEALDAERARFWRNRLRRERDALEAAVEGVIRRRVVARDTQTESGTDGKA